MIKGVEDIFTDEKRLDIPGLGLIELGCPAPGAEYDRTFHTRGLAGKHICPGIADHPGGTQID